MKFKHIALVFTLVTYSTCYSQVEVTICQKCFSKDIFIGGHETLLGTPLPDSCILYTFNIKEPEYLFFAFGADGLHRERLWIDPRFKKRTIRINNCDNTMERFDTLSIERDDFICEKAYSDLTKNENEAKEDSLMKRFRFCEEAYIQAHPDSFLALNYLRTILTSLNINKVIEYRDLIQKNNVHYPGFAEIQRYIVNHNYNAPHSLGDAFFEFKAQTYHGNKFKSELIKNKIILLYFWSVNCGPCKKASEQLRLLYQRYKSNAFEIISFSVDDDVEWKKGSEKANYPWINVADGTGMHGILPSHYNVDRYPFFVIFDQEKKTKLITFGDEYPLIELKIKELLQIK